MFSNIFDLIGRIFISSIFLLSGINKFKNYEDSHEWMESFGVPGILLIPAIVLEILAPVLIIAGKQDEISGFEQSNRFYYVLKRLGHDVEKAFFERSGHGHQIWYYDQVEAALANDFLERKLNLNSTLTNYTESEKNFIYARRSVVTKAPIKTGDVLTRKNITTKRPFVEGAVPASDFNQLLGQKMKQDLEYAESLSQIAEIQEGLNKQEKAAKLIKESGIITSLMVLGIKKADLIQYLKTYDLEKELK